MHWTVIKKLSLFFILITCLGGFACDHSVKCYFNIESGDAVIRLNEFATQANVEILLESSKVKGIHTRAIKGNMTPLSALKLMIKDTPLSYYEDPKSKAYSVFILSSSPHDHYK